MGRTSGKVTFTALAFLAWVFANPAVGLESAWQGVPEGEVRLISAQTGIDEDGGVLLGLQFRIRQGWKTYWRYAGESGAPPFFDWQGSQNLQSVAVRWPAPKRFSSFGFDSFGYGDSFVLPVEAVRQTPGRPLGLRVRIDFQICENICVPVGANLALTIPAVAAAGTRHQITIAAFQDRVPKSAASAPFALDGVALSEENGKATLRVAFDCRDTHRFANPDLMVEGPKMFGFGRPANKISRGGCRVDMRLPVYADAPLEELHGAALTLTLVDGGTAGEFTVILN